MNTICRLHPLLVSAAIAASTLSVLPGSALAHTSAVRKARIEQIQLQSVHAISRLPAYAVNSTMKVNGRLVLRIRVYKYYNSSLFAKLDADGKEFCTAGSDRNLYSYFASDPQRFNLTVLRRGETLTEAVSRLLSESKNDYSQLLSQIFMPNFGLNAIHSLANDLHIRYSLQTTPAHYIICMHPDFKNMLASIKKGAQNLHSAHGLTQASQQEMKKIVQQMAVMFQKMQIVQIINRRTGLNEEIKLILPSVPGSAGHFTTLIFRSQFVRLSAKPKAFTPPPGACSISEKSLQKNHFKPMFQSIFNSR